IVTLVSSLSFWKLRPRDGEAVSAGATEPVAQASPGLGVKSQEVLSRN
ncbi:MAG: hypothetical protein JWQ13_4428, partial [Ramlibacter sp.]|nr:hypothetical protein [Ramlibacter sp.]